MVDKIIVYTCEFEYGWICVNIDDLYEIAYGPTQAEALDSWDATYREST